jgi:hypothetical protein
MRVTRQLRRPMRASAESRGQVRSVTRPKSRAIIGIGPGAGAAGHLRNGVSPNGRQPSAAGTSTVIDGFESSYSLIDRCHTAHRDSVSPPNGENQADAMAENSAPSTPLRQPKLPCDSHGL